MKANEVPMKIYLNPDAVPHNQSGKFLFIHNSDIDESKCTIEYTRTDAFIDKACEWLEKNGCGYWLDDSALPNRDLIDEFRKYMKGE